MKKAKFVFIQVKIQCGEYEFNSKSVHEISSRKSVDKFGKDWVKDFFGKKAWVDGDTHYFNGGEVAARVSNVQEITKEEYQVLSKFML